MKEKGILTGRGKIKHVPAHAMKRCGVVEVWIQSLLISNYIELSSQRQAQAAGETASGTLRIEVFFGRGGPEAVMDVSERIKISYPWRESNHDYSVVYSITWSLHRLNCLGYSIVKAGNISYC
jgi:hypothetical protein